MKTIHGVEIYENLKETVDPAHTCLVVWDVQLGLVNRIFNRDAFLSSLRSLLEGYGAGCLSSTHSSRHCLWPTNRLEPAFYDAQV